MLHPPEGYNKMRDALDVGRLFCMKKRQSNGCKHKCRCDAEVTGGVPEWPKGSDCKSDGSAFEGSNPSPSTISLRFELSGLEKCGHRIMAITSAFQADDAGSIPAARSKMLIWLR